MTLHTGLRSIAMVGTLGLMSLGLITPAHASTTKEVAPTCNGLAVTITSSARHIRGTSGADVI